MHPLRLLAPAIGLTVVLAHPMTARAETTRIDLTPPIRLLDHRLVPWGSPGNAPPPIMNPMLAEGLTGLGTSVATIALSLWLGSAFLATDSPNLAVAALPPVLLLIALPPIAVTYAEWAVGRALGEDVRVQPTIYIALAVQLVTVLGAVIIPILTNSVVSANNPPTILLFAAADAVIVPGAVALSMNLQRKMRPRPPVADAVVPATKPATDRAVEPAPGGISLYRTAF